MGKNIYVLTPTYINNSLVVRGCMVNIFSSCTNPLTLTCDNSKQETERVSLQVEGDHVDLFEGNPSECHSLENSHKEWQMEPAIGSAEGWIESPELC